ncbi:hypothetical protein SAMN05444166_6467 [Singulisphaera sp. GP187]|uniref:hypothetical protein n=1 Tax=Singulisphaera sp. GP187 TaxID=1882752 RepID=UPI00092A0900|nr:hypothetical protein [Singulisphaera sp. GP187]SIO60631.1 hypothetical protein SAMN05444166_6467 [Singulisphaera sp. GP187]
MIGRCLFEHLTRPSARVIPWVALVACLGGCAVPLTPGGNDRPSIDWTHNPPSIHREESVEPPTPDPATKVAAVEVAALPPALDPTKVEFEEVAALPPPPPPPPSTIEGEEVAALPPPPDPSKFGTGAVAVIANEKAPAGVSPGTPEVVLPMIALPELDEAAPAVPLKDPAVQLSGKEASLLDESVLPVACTSCGQFHGAGHSDTFGGSCGPGGCIPGRSKSCYHAEASTYFGRLASNLYHCLCCPDPCYEPTWVPEANASFFVDPARPRTQKRLRWDHGNTLWFPDRSEYFWARSFRGPGPQPRQPVTKSGKPIYGERLLNYDQLYVYMEAALPRFSFFTEIPYRSTSPDLTAHHAGFSDMNIGTKSLLLDCDLIQLALQFKTYLPIGSVTQGLGNGHVSLEPSLLMALHLAPHTYLQGQIAEWVPLGGDPNYAGAILHYHLSMNQLLCNVMPDVPLIGTLEFNGWSFQDGAFTAPVLGPQNSSGDSYLSIGPGLRMAVCNYIDFGVGTAFSLNTPNWGDPLIRSEIRIFY